MNSTGIQAGHADHTGQVWNDTLKAQHEKWGDIIPPINEPQVTGSVSIPGIEFTYDGMNWNDAGIAIYNNNCDPVQPTAPTTTTTAPQSGTTTTLPTTSSNTVLPPTAGGTTTTTTPGTKGAIAFTGANSWATGGAGLALIGLGSGMVLLARRRTRHAR